MKHESANHMSAEEEIRHMAFYTRSLIEASFDPLVTIGPDGTITDVNSATEKVTGRTRQELIGSDFSDYFTEPEKVKKGYKQVFEKGTVRDYPLDIRHKNGKITPVLYNAAVYKDDSGKVIGVFAAARDITERKRVQEALQKEIKEHSLAEEALRQTAVRMQIAYDQAINYAKELNKEITNRKRAEESLRKAHDELEKRVQNRTSELAKANEQLKREITDRKLAEEALKESNDELEQTLSKLKNAQEHMSNIFQGAGDAMRVIDKDFNILQANIEMDRLAGMPAGESVGKKCCEILRGESCDTDKCSLRQVLAGEKRVDIESIEKTGCGGKIYVRVVSSPLIQNGEVAGVIESIRDISERKKAQEKLRQSENKYRMLLENLPQKIFHKDRDSLYVSCNENLARDLKIKSVEIKGKTDHDLFPKELAEKYRADDNRIMMSGKTENIEEKYLQDGKEVWVHTVKTPIRDKDSTVTGVLGIFWDITEQKQAEQEKKALQSQILQSEKMASIGQLAAGVAHEINNPTGFVSSNLETLSDYQDDISTLIEQYRSLAADLKETMATAEYPVAISEQLERITDLEAEVDIDFVLNDISDLVKESREGTERIKKIVLDLKDFAHPGDQELKYADINRNLDSTLNVVWNELKYKATVTKDYGNLPEVRCYPQQLNQVFVNLLVNAAQAIEKQGEIKIRTSALDGKVEINISDTGKGIPEENLSKIFDPFFTTKEVGKGTGLNLNVAYNIIKKHKGTIDVESTVGVGTTFKIRIPTG